MQWLGNTRRIMAQQNQHFSVLRRATAERSVGLKAWLALLCVLFLSTQTQGLAHSHDGDLSLQPDCEVCLKVSTDDEVVQSSSNGKSDLTPPTAIEYTGNDVAVQSVLARQARAPPTI